MSLRRVEADLPAPDGAGPEERGRRLRASRRSGTASSRPPCSSPCCPPPSCCDAAARAARPGSVARSRPSPTCAAATTSCTRTTASAASSASTPRRSAASSATTCTSSSTATTACTCRTTSWRRSAATSAPTARRPRSPSSAARPGARSRAAPAWPCASWPASCSPCTPAARTRCGRRSTPTTSGWRAWRPRSRSTRPTTRASRSTPSSRTSRPPQPMDRLVCGDVGFGKTEVAVRAAFKVASSGRQVLMLVPTTILAQQHAATLRDRFRDFPVRVEMVSRFRAAAEVKEVLAEFADGKVDVLVGTHRVLSRDVVPQNLGLVVLDEEQRFGVAQKELLRQLRLEVDVLAMSATPIPRTLHMSLSGLRDITVITTPPRGRHPIKTHVGEFDEELIAAALRRETRPRRPVVLPAQPGRVDRRGGRAGAPLGARAARRRRPRADGRAGARGRDDEVPARRLRRARARRPSSSRASTSRRPTRSSSSAPTCSAWPSCTRSAAASAAPTRSPTRSCSTPTGASSPRRRGTGSRPWPTTPSSAPATGSPCATWSCAAPATCSATSSRGTSPRSASSSTASCWPRRWPSCRARRRRRRAPVRVDAQVDAYVPADYVPLEAVKIDLHRRVALAADRSRAARGRGRARRPLRPAARAGRKPDRDPGAAARAAAEMGIADRVAARRHVHRRAGRARLGRDARRCASASPRCATRSPSRELSLRPPVQPPGDAAECVAGAGIARCYTSKSAARSRRSSLMGRIPLIICLAALAAIRGRLWRLVVVDPRRPRFGPATSPSWVRTHITKSDLDHQIKLELAAMKVKKQTIPQVGTTSYSRRSCSRCCSTWSPTRRCTTSRDARRHGHAEGDPGPGPKAITQFYGGDKAEVRGRPQEATS